MVPNLLLIAYHLGVPYCRRVPPDSGGSEIFSGGAWAARSRILNGGLHSWVLGQSPMPPEAKGVWGQSPQQLGDFYNFYEKWHCFDAFLLKNVGNFDQGYANFGGGWFQVTKILS